MTQKTLAKVAFFFLGVFFFLCFIVFTLIVRARILKQFDFDIMVKIQNLTPKRFDSIFSFFSLASSFEVTMIFLFLIFLLLRKKLFALASYTSFALAHIIEIIGKTLLDHPSPPFQFHRFNFGFTFPSSYVHPGGSYPSGHSLRAIFIILIIAFIINLSKKLKKELKWLLNIFLLTIISVMLYSRVSLGEHWLTDVVGGSLLGLAFGFFSLIFL